MMRFRLLGPLEVATAAGWHGIGAAKQRAILAELLLRPGQVVPADALAERVWGECCPPSARSLVRKYVMELRRLIGDTEAAVLARRDPGYLLRVEPGELDAERFEQLAREGRRELRNGAHERAESTLRDALALWRGEPFVDVPGSALTESEAVRLRELRLDALEARIEADLRCGAGAGAVAELRPLVAQHRLRESLWHLLMRALCSCDRTAEALATYAQVSRILDEELGTRPGELLWRLHRDILDGRAN
ncbi:AfsR/SARP family transcriptional regulator [Actinomadura barringtoniae]|uniref:AfsR/SARP family transcriptional regulator n=1 Tax=Actinomadura barringtoniae TaxID=1427535 RepID=A0A939T796_9ACTN|nr:AfsR/SARP family transcriptional regulator [Actinomadura barringtoniae]MBO2451779.1 AfsR/SARP family transcriptional regulator [Actinomadura barringtoniae]